MRNKKFLLKLVLYIVFLVFLAGCSNKPSKDKITELQNKYETAYNTYTDLTQKLIDKGVFQDNPSLAKDYQEIGVNFEETGKAMAELEDATIEEITQLMTSLDNITTSLFEFSKYVE